MDTQSHYLVFPPSFGEPLLSISLTSDRSFCIPSDPPSRDRLHVRTIDQDRRNKRKTLRGQGESHKHATAIGVLPDNVLLEIFDFCQMNPGVIFLVWKWHVLVHVCRRWRQIIFESPRRLNLQILCTHGTPAKKNLGIWPAFPIVVHYRNFRGGITPEDEGNIISVFEHRDRVCFVMLDNVTGSQLGEMATVMREPFPVLRSLTISLDPHDLDYGNAPVIPAKFLGGSAPCLQDFSLSGIPYPALPTLLLSASDLVSLVLHDIPPTGYISPKEMVVGLAALPRLKYLTIEFQLATPHPVRIHPPPVTQTVLPSLTSFRYRGASEYLEDLVARWQIDTPQMDLISIDYFNQLVDYRIPQLTEFIDRSFGPKLTLFRHARVSFNYQVTVEIRKEPQVQMVPVPSSSDECMNTTIRCDGIDWQVSHLAQVVSQFFTTISTVVHLRLEIYSIQCRLSGIEDIDWLHLLHSISGVQTLFVDGALARHIAFTLQGITGEMVSEVLPSLHLICLGYYYPLSKPAPPIDKFINARRLCGRPVTVVEYSEFMERLKSYLKK